MGLFSRASGASTEARSKGRKFDQLQGQIAENITSAVMMIDRDFNVIYVNKPTRDLLSSNLSEFRKLWPDFSPDTIVGTCIDIFHKNPAHQRKLLADPSRLPMQTEITVGNLKISLLVSGSYDKNGNYVGNILEWKDVTEARIHEGMIVALNKSQAIIEFSMDGRIVHANENFLNTIGYSLGEIRGQHHSMFVDAGYRQSPEYQAFWDKLGRGEFDAGQYKRVGKDGREVWIQASYNPILDAAGRPFKVVKFATDITPMRVAVEQMRDAVMAAKSNDLSRRISMADKTGELETLCGGVNELLNSMTSVISEFRAASAEVASAAAEISSATNDLSHRTEEQAASLEETSSSMAMIAATVKQTTDNAGQANHLTRAARELADRSGEVVGEAVAAMARIADSSHKISDIISVIDEIARQTNLLALNAAVEAARAGEAGRGFAVVASEVRSLAQRSSQAAKDIKDLIMNSSGQVRDGVELVNRAGASLGEIMDSIKQVADIVADIAVASGEQAAGIEQINLALTQMDQATQRNSAMVEENAATARILQQHAAAMDEQIGRFCLGAQDAAKAKAVKPAMKQPEYARPPVAASRGARRGRAATAAAIARDEWQEF